MEWMKATTGVREGGDRRGERREEKGKGNTQKKEETLGEGGKRDPPRQTSNGEGAHFTGEKGRKENDIVDSAIWKGKEWEVRA